MRAFGSDADLVRIDHEQGGYLATRHLLQYPGLQRAAERGAPVLAICAGVCIYFFHKFVLDDIKLFTCLQIFIPFAIFFFLSLFTVYLKRPVIRRVQREAPRPAPQRSAEPERRAPSRDDTFTEMNTGRYRENNEPERRVDRRV